MEEYPFMFIMKEKSEDFYCRKCGRQADYDMKDNILSCPVCRIFAECVGDPRD